jgi:hypothetical protein
MDPADAEIDMAVEVAFVEFDNGLVLHQFRPAATS